MATEQQLQVWTDKVLAIIDGGEQDVNAIIKKQGRLSTLVALENLVLTKTIIRAGNTVFRPGQRQFFKPVPGSPF